MITHEHDVAAHARRVLQLRDGVVVADDRQDPGAGPRELARSLR
jgi:hypothetical protein